MLPNCRERDTGARISWSGSLVIACLSVIIDEDVVRDCVLNPAGKDPFSDFLDMLCHLQMDKGL